MDNETTDTGAARPTLPKGGAAFEPAAALGTAPEPHAEDKPSYGRPSQALIEAAGTDAESRRADRTGVFQHLVHEDNDIAGLVAYSIYKQNKLDWLRAFETAKGRPPDEAELAAYIIGEGTPRRLAIYRHLAEATLAGNGPEIDGGAGSRPAFARRAGFDRGAMNVSLIATYALIALLFLIGLWLAAHFTMSSR